MLSTVPLTTTQRLERDKLLESSTGKEPIRWVPSWMPTVTVDQYVYFFVVVYLPASNTRTSTRCTAGFELFFSMFTRT